MRAPVRLYLASSNPGKLAEFQSLAAGGSAPESVAVEPVAEFASLPTFEEKAPTFAENALGKALHYSHFCDGLVFADDSGLVIPALGGAPGVQSARYAGPEASNEERIAKLLAAMQGLRDAARSACFVCVIAAARSGRGVAIVSDRVNGKILEAARGRAGFGYDPVFYFSAVGRAFAELSREEKNRHSHRGKAFRKLITAITADNASD